jgi:hypothetical protein
MSNALEMSTATATVLPAGFLQLNPQEILLTRGRRAEVQEWSGLNPCWEGETKREEVIVRSRRHSRILPTRLRREIGR